MRSQGHGGAALAAALFLAACAPRASEHSSGTDSAATAARATRDPAGRVAGSTIAAAIPVPVEVERICVNVAAWWRREPGATVRVVDGLAQTPMGDSVTGCVVVADQEHGRKPAGEAKPDTTAASLGTGVTLYRATGSGWIELVRFMADGPDGSSSTWQRGPVRCAVALSWDGGDDSDPSYVPDDWYREETICWWEPGGVAVTDTAPE